MKTHRDATSSGARVRRVVALSALAGIAFLPWPNSRAEATSPAVDFHVISAGGASLHNSCFRLSGTAGQAAPGYSSNASDSIVAGFWSAAPTLRLDEIHFNGFESC